MDPNHPQESYQPTQAGSEPYFPPPPKQEGDFPAYNPQDYADAPQLPPRPVGTTVQQGASAQAYGPPPTRLARTESDPNSPVHYTRDPHKLVAYLVPFPKPKLHGVPADAIPPRFLIYTPPPPPLKAPKEGEKEDRLHKVQRKWQEEVRAAKTSTAKTASWKGVKSKATRGISKAMGFTKSSNLEFLNRIGAGSDDENDHEGEETHKTVGLEEMVLVYPQSVNMEPDRLKQEFVDTMMRSKSKAQRDAILATGLLPIDGVWAYASIRGAKTSRNVTKRLTSSSHTGKHDEDTLRLSFTPSPRLELLDHYLAAKCHEREKTMFPSAGVPPTESDVLEAIGWSPSQPGGEKNWEDEQWEISEVKDDLKSVMAKGAREWDKWVKAFEKDPEKAMKK